jgi:hypothetical protein
MVANLVARNASEAMMVPVWWDLVESVFGESLESGGQLVHFAGIWLQSP